MNIIEKILHILFSGLFLVFLFERGYFQAKAMRISGEAKNIRKDKKKLIITASLFVVAQIWVIGSFIWIIKPSLMDWTSISIPQWVRWLGLILTITGMILECSTQIYLGRNYSTTVNISEEQTLITKGPYKYVRHPMYSALFTIGTGLGLLSSSWYFLLPFLATLIVVINRVQNEEKAMIEKFGEEYISYIQKTGRFIPSLRRN